MTELQQETGDVGTGWMAAILVALAVMGIYLFASTRTTLWDRDEPLYARATVEMVESGNYLVPTFNNDMWPDKPILSYWLMSLPVRLLGPTEFACRFFAAVGAALTCLLTFFMGKRLLSVKAGLWAMVILASTSMVLSIGTLAISDAVLLPFIVGALVVFVHSFGLRVRVFHIVLIGIALGFGMLAKGPIGLLPIPVIIVTLWLGRKVGLGTWRHLWGGGVALIVGGIILVAWAVPANNATDGEFLRVFIGRDVIGRALRPMEHHGGNFLLYLPYYLPVVIAGFFPWTLHLPGAISAVVGGRVGGQYCRALLIGWVVPIFVMMSLAATKLPHYILFIWPALTLAVAGTIVAAQQQTLTARDRIWLRRGVWFFGPLVVVAALVLSVGPWFLQIPGLRWSGLASGVVLLAMGGIAVRLQRANQPHTSAKVLLLGMLVFHIPFLLGVLPAVERVKISPTIAQAIKVKTAKEVPVAAYGYAEPSLNFYIGRQIERLGSEEAVIAWARQSQPGVLVIPKDVLDRIQQHHGPLALDEIAAAKGINYVKGTMLEVLALVRRPEDL